MKALVIILILLGLYFVFFNPIATAIRKINNIIQKDRTVCDFINFELQGWLISPVQSDGLRIVIKPIGMPAYYLYILYNDQRPSNENIKQLYYELSNENSLITKAHRNNMTYEMYKERQK